MKILEHPQDDWIVYWAGAFLTLVWKWFVWCWTGWEQGKTVRQSTKEWFDISLTPDKASWITTIAVVWVFGSVFINKTVFLWEWVRSVPVIWSIDFLFGSLMEKVAPDVVKWVVNKFQVPEN